LLLLVSGWTQERIAAKVGGSPQWVAQHLSFGEFLDFYRGRNRRLNTPWPSIPPNLTERLFRTAWSKTPKHGPDGKRYSKQERLEQVRGDNRLAMQSPVLSDPVRLPSGVKWGLCSHFRDV
jgi:hypothetical protein